MIVWILYWLHWNRRGRNIKYGIIIIKENVYTEQVDALLRHQFWLKKIVFIQCNLYKLILLRFQLHRTRCLYVVRSHASFLFVPKADSIIQIKCHLNLLSIRIKVHAGFFYHTEIAHTVVRCLFFLRSPDEYEEKKRWIRSCIVWTAKVINM